MRHPTTAAALQIHRVADLVDSIDLAGGLAGPGVAHAAALPHPMILRREAIAVYQGPLHGLDDALVHESAERLVRLDALGVGQVVFQMEVRPPERLLLAPVPRQELRQQPARLLLACPLSR